MHQHISTPQKFNLFNLFTTCVPHSEKNDQQADRAKNYLLVVTRFATRNKCLTSSNYHFGLLDFQGFSQVAQGCVEFSHLQRVERRGVERAARPVAVRRKNMRGST